MRELDLHQAARRIFEVALRRVDAREATLRALNLHGSVLRVGAWETKISAREVYVIAVGKASVSMATAVAEILEDRITAGLVIGDSQFSTDSLNPIRWQVFRGAHPLPTQQSLDGAQAAIKLLQHANERRALVIFLISGGGSAMLEWPRDDRITLADLREANRQLVLCGASITEVNAVRRAFSAVKGGKLSAMAPNADQITLIISDTNRGDEASVASGPTMAQTGNGLRAMDVVERYSQRLSLPSTVLAAIQAAQTDAGQPDNANFSYQVLLDNQSAIEAADAEARELGFAVEVADDLNEQPVDEGSTLLISRVQSLWESAGSEQKRVCLISGGEFSCPVNGTGIGGRNLETVLRCAIEFDRRQHDGEFRSAQLVILSAGTDGIDGNSPAAGGIADETTIARGLALGLDAETSLRNSDSFSFFNALGGAVVTGPTGTNVRDLRILMASS
jgi:glycerate 2-kinase